MQSPTRLWFVMNSGRQIYAVEREVQMLLMDNFIGPRSWDGQHMLNHCDLWDIYNLQHQLVPDEVSISSLF